MKYNLMLLLKDYFEIAFNRISATSRTWIFSSNPVVFTASVIVRRQKGHETAIISDAKVEGGEIETAFNAIYLLEALSNIGTDQVQIEFNTETSPSIVRPIGKDDYIHIVMPLKI